MSTVNARGRGDQQFLLGLKTEWFVARRSLRPWLLTLLPAAAVALRLLLTKLSQAGAGARADLMGAGDAVSQNAYGYFVDGLLTGFTLLYLVFIALAAFSFAGDRDQGVLRHLVTRSVSRRTLVAAKFSLVLMLALLAAALVVLVAWLCAGAFWSYGPVVEDGFELIGVAEIHDEIALGLQLALMPLAACVALGLLISVAARSATQAVTFALGIALAVDIFKGVLGGAANFIYASYQPSLLDRSYLSEVARIARGYSDVFVNEGVIQLNLWIPMPQAAIFMLLALIWVSRKKL